MRTRVMMVTTMTGGAAIIIATIALWLTLTPQDDVNGESTSPTSSPLVSASLRITVPTSPVSVDTQRCRVAVDSLVIWVVDGEATPTVTPSSCRGLSPGDYARLWRHEIEDEVRLLR